ncbi:MAG: hypothetical protein WDN46_17480 [Methylocella sp.]
MRSSTKIHADNGVKLSAVECGNLTWFEIIDLAEPYMPSQFQFCLHGVEHSQLERAVAAFNAIMSEGAAEPAQIAMAAE